MSEYLRVSVAGGSYLLDRDAIEAVEFAAAGLAPQGSLRRAARPRLTVDAAALSGAPPQALAQGRDVVLLRASPGGMQVGFLVDKAERIESHDESEFHALPAAAAFLRRHVDGVFVARADGAVALRLRHDARPRDFTLAKAWRRAALAPVATR